MMSDVAASGGFIFGALVPLLLLLCFKQDVTDYHIIWRLSVALGLIPPISIFWFRYRMAVSTAYRKSAAKKDIIPLKPIVRRYWKNILGCCFGFFMLVLALVLFRL
jgi:hypothetical protein